MWYSAERNLSANDFARGFCKTEHPPRDGMDKLTIKYEIIL